MEESYWTEEQLIAYIRRHNCPSFNARQLKRYRLEKVIQVHVEHPDFGSTLSLYLPEAGPQAAEVYQLLKEKRNFDVVRLRLWQRGRSMELSLLKQSLSALTPKVPISVPRSAFVNRQVEAMLRRLEKHIRSSEWRTVLQGLTREEDQRAFLTMQVSFLAGAEYIFDPFTADTFTVDQRENEPEEFTTSEIFKRGLHLEEARFLPEDISSDLNHFSLKRLLSLTKLQEDLESATEAELLWANDHLELIDVLAQFSEMTGGTLFGPPQFYRLAKSTGFQAFALLVFLRLSKYGYRENIHLLLDALRIQIPAFQRLQAFYHTLRRELPRLAKEFPSLQEVSRFTPEQQNATDAHLHEVYQQNKSEIDAFMQRHPELNPKEWLSPQSETPAES